MLHHLEEELQRKETCLRKACKQREPMNMLFLAPKSFGFYPLPLGFDLLLSLSWLTLFWVLWLFFFSIPIYL